MLTFDRMRIGQEYSVREVLRSATTLLGDTAYVKVRGPHGRYVVFELVKRTRYLCTAMHQADDQRYVPIFAGVP